MPRSRRALRLLLLAVALVLGACRGRRARSAAADQRRHAARRPPRRARQPARRHAESRPAGRGEHRLHRRLRALGPHAAVAQRPDDRPLPGGDRRPEQRIGGRGERADARQPRCARPAGARMPSSATGCCAAPRVSTPASTATTTPFRSSKRRVRCPSASRRIPPRRRCGRSRPAARSRDARCFVWVHYQDPHGPYQPPEELRERFLERERAAHDGRRTLPAAVRLLGSGRDPELSGPGRPAARSPSTAPATTARSRTSTARSAACSRGSAPGAERAIVVFSADHGESLGEQDLWFAHGEHLTEAQVRVPVWLRIPGRRPARRDDVASLLDLHATLLGLATGAAAAPAAPRPRPARARCGEGLEPRLSRDARGLEGEALRLDRGWLQVRASCIATTSGRVSCFGSATTRIDLAAPAPQLAASLRERIAEFRERMPEVEPVMRAEPFSEEDRANLRALGYEATEQGDAA